MTPDFLAAISRRLDRDRVNAARSPGVWRPPQPVRTRIRDLRREYEALRSGKESLLALIDEAEIPESVYR